MFLIIIYILLIVQNADETLYVEKSSNDKTNNLNSNSPCILRRGGILLARRSGKAVGPFFPFLETQHVSGQHTDGWRCTDITKNNACRQLQTLDGQTEDRAASRRLFDGADNVPFVDVGAVVQI